MSSYEKVVNRLKRYDSVIESINMIPFGNKIVYYYKIPYNCSECNESISSIICIEFLKKYTSKRRLNINHRILKRAFVRLRRNHDCS